MYWMEFNKPGNYNLSYEVLSWPTCLLIIRSFSHLPQRSELDALLEELHENWCGNSALRSSFKSFLRYLFFRYSGFPGSLPVETHFDFSSIKSFPKEEYSDLGYYDLHDIEQNHLLNELGILQSRSLL